jgi:hypothetical protein
MTFIQLLCEMVALRLIQAYNFVSYCVTRLASCFQEFLLWCDQRLSPFSYCIVEKSQSKLFCDMFWFGDLARYVMRFLLSFLNCLLSLQLALVILYLPTLVYDLPYGP